MFLPVLPMYLKDTNIVVFIYDYTNEQTFNDLDLYINKAQSVDPDSKLTKVLISNELHQSPRKVSREEGIKKAKEIGAMFTEVSCITRSGMDDLFENIVEYHYQIMVKQLKPPINHRTNQTIWALVSKEEKKYALFNEFELWHKISMEV